MLHAKLLAVVASLATADVVRNAAELRAALADGAPTIELAADAYLEGEELSATSPCVIDGRGHALLQTGARHLKASARLELRDLTLAVVDAPTAQPTCAPTASTKAPTVLVEPLELTNLTEPNLGTCPPKSAAGGEVLVLSAGGLSPGGFPCDANLTRVFLADGAIVDLPVKAERLFVDGLTGTAIAAETGMLHFVGPDGQIFSHAVPADLNLKYLALLGGPGPGGTAVVQMDTDSRTLNVYRASNSSGPLLRTELFDFLSVDDWSDDPVNKIFRFAYDDASSAFYVVGEMKNKNEDKVRPHFATRLDFDGQSFTVAWVRPFVPPGKGAREVMLRRQGPTSPAYEILVLDEEYLARIDAEDGTMAYMTEWELPDADKTRIAYDGVSDDLYLVGRAKSLSTLLYRYDLLSGETTWTIDYLAAFEALRAKGTPSRAHLYSFTEGLKLLVYANELSNANETYFIATFSGDTPVGDSIPTSSPTRCDEGPARAEANVTASGCVLIDAGASFVADGVEFSGCSSAGDGGAVQASGANVRLRDCVFDGPTSAGAGGAVAIAGGDLDVSGCTFVDSRSLEGNGGAIRAINASVRIRSSTFTDIIARNRGGAVFASGKPLVVDNTTFRRCESDQSDGGAIYADCSSTISHSTFTGCNADVNGAALVLTSLARTSQATSKAAALEATITSCTFKNCGAQGEKNARDTIRVRDHERLEFWDNVMIENTPGQALITLATLSSISFSGSRFEGNVGQVVRGFQLFDGKTEISDCKFISNTYSVADEGLVYLKESPDHEINIKDSDFIANKGDGQGSALHLKTDANVDRCRFERNHANEGGAIYLDPVASLKVIGSSFTNNTAKNAGGAIAACARSKDNTCSGSYDLVDIVAEGNTVSDPDQEKSGGGFAKFNGGMPVTLRRATITGNTARGKPSALGLRYATVNLHEVNADGTILLSNNGKITTYCSPGLDIVEDDTTARNEWVDDTTTATEEECSLCLPGSEWVDTPAYECVECPRGKFKAAGDNSCQRCSGSRKVASSTGQETCDTCKSGKTANNNHTKCKNEWLVPLLIAVAIAAGVSFFAFLGWRFRRLASKAAKGQAERALIVQEQCIAARDRVREFQAHFVTVPGSVFVGFDRLRPQEELRDEIIVYDSVADVRDASTRGEVFIFFSHQWLGWSEPDPDRIHVAAMQQAVHNVSNDTETPLEKIRVWVDYVSIPQKNRSVQKLAIASLPTFASCADYFIVVAPDATHKNTGAFCGSRSYRSRAWCRAEIMSCWARNGTSDMYFNTNDGLRKLAPTGDEILLHEALDVMHGEFTCCRLGHPDEEPCDREALMLPLLGLYADVYAQRNGKVGSKSRLDESRADAYKFIEPLKDTLFPATFEYTHRDSDGVETTTTQVLFGDLIAAVEESIDGVDADNTSRDFQPGTNAQRHRLHHAKHGHASGGLGLLMRRNSSRGLKRSGSTLQRSGSTASRTDEENVQAPVGRRPALNRSATWRTSAPSVEM